jgi:Protein of unknown function (DUF2854)
MLRQTSLATLGLALGSVLTIVGIVAYFATNTSLNDYSTLNLIGFFYGIPLLLGGLALKTTELKPAPFSVPTSPSVLALRSQQATETQTKIRKDVTRYCYGQNAHLDRALTFLGLGSDADDLPQLLGIRETEVNGAYVLVLEFSSPEIPFESWQQKQEKMEKYFGPNVKVELTQPATDQVEVSLVTLPAS